MTERRVTLSPLWSFPSKRRHVTTAVEDQCKAPGTPPILMDSLAELYMRGRQMDKALGIHLKLKRGDVFDLIGTGRKVLEKGGGGG